MVKQDTPVMRGGRMSPTNLSGTAEQVPWGRLTEFPQVVDMVQEGPKACPGDELPWRCSG